MKGNVKRLCIIMFIVASATPARAQSGVVGHLERSGLLTITNARVGVAYDVEWASRLSTNSAEIGLWSRSWESLRDIVATNEVLTFQVPIYYRIRARGASSLVLIPQGVFQMGDNHFDVASRRPVHGVDLSAFYMEVYEVSNMLWDTVYNWGLIQGGYQFDNVAVDDANIMPARGISWYDAVKWCNARSEREGMTPVYYTGTQKTNVYRTGQLDLASDWVQWEANGYRLPTEAEWEKAARGGLVGHHYPWDSDGDIAEAEIDGCKANYECSGDPHDPRSCRNGGNENATCPVGYFSGNQECDCSGCETNDMRNGFGLYDVAGNAAEWCWDWYRPEWYGQPGATAQDTRGPGSGTARVVRGGSANDETVGKLRCASRWSFAPDEAPEFGESIGLRCVRSSM